MITFNAHRPWFSYRGFVPHKLMPILGVHKAFQWKQSLTRLLH